MLQRKFPLGVESRHYRDLPYQPNKSLLTDPTIKDRHLAEAVRSMDYSQVEKIFQQAAIIAAKEVK